MLISQWNERRASNASITSNSTTELVAFDVAKYLFACLIPFLHIGGTGVLGSFVGQYIARLGVPFFFAAAGYFLQKSIESSTNPSLAYRKWIKRVAKLFATWEIIYAPFQIVSSINSYGVKEGVAHWVQDLIMLTPSYLWYMSAMIVGLILFALFRNRRAWIPICLTLYAIGVMGNSYSTILHFDSTFDFYFRFFETTRNGVFFAFPIISVGAFAYNHASKGAERVVLVASIIALWCEITLVRSFVDAGTDTSMYFLIPLVTYALIKCCEHSSIWNRVLNQQTARLLRTASTAVYVMQYGVIMTISLLLGPLNGTVIGFWMTWILVVSLGTLAAFVATKNRHVMWLF